MAAAKPMQQVLTAATLVSELKNELAGQALTAARPRGPIVWVDGGDEVIVHRDSLKIRFAPGALVISVELESDETGRHAITVPLSLDAIARDKKLVPGASGFFAVTDREAHGPAPLVARWGTIVQDALFSGLVAIAQRHAAASGRAPHGIAVDHLKRQVQLVEGPRGQR